jgi:hypothetical protein
MSLGTLGIGAAGLAGSFDADEPQDRQMDVEMKYTLDSMKKIMPQWLGLEREFAPQWNDLFAGEYGRSTGQLLDVFGREVAPRLRELEAGDREATAESYASVAPKAREAVRALHPEEAAMVDKLLGISRERVESGMSGGERRDVQEAIRGAQAARGVGFGPNDVFELV